MINGGYYRYGYENGLAIIVDDEYRIQTVGYHNQNKITKNELIQSKFQMAFSRMLRTFLLAILLQRSPEAPGAVQMRDWELRIGFVVLVFSHSPSNPISM